jgi:hypothetical protein
MADSNPFVDHLATTAKKLVTDVGGVVNKASEELKKDQSTGPDHESYSAAKFIASTAELTNVVFADGLDFARAAIDFKPSDGLKTVIDQMEVIAKRMISETGKVAADTSTKLDQQQYTPTEWVKSMIRFADIALFGGIELAETALAGPEQYEKPPITETVTVTADPLHDRLVTLVSLSRDGVLDPASARTTFDLPDNVLPKGQTTFVVRVDPAGLASGVFEGELHLDEIDAASPKGVVKQDKTFTIQL